VVASVLIQLILLLSLFTGLALIVVGTTQTMIARRRRAREKAHILKRVADLEEHRR
jgi:hypothetical protein